MHSRKLRGTHPRPLQRALAAAGEGAEGGVEGAVGAARLPCIRRPLTLHCQRPQDWLLKV